MNVEKTTLYLDSTLRRRLRQLAAERRTTMTSLIAEGARLVVARYVKRPTSSELQRRADEAFERLLRGFPGGPPDLSERIDDILYPVPRTSRKTGRR